MRLFRHPVTPLQPSLSERLETSSSGGPSLIDYYEKRASSLSLKLSRYLGIDMCYRLAHRNPLYHGGHLGSNQVDVVMNGVDKRTVIARQVVGDDGVEAR